MEGSDPPVQAGRTSCGHRLVASEVDSSGVGLRRLVGGAGVMVNRQQRRQLIADAIAAGASGRDARADLPDELLEELTDLVERPS